MIPGRSYAVAAGVEVADGAEGRSSPTGRPGGHALYVKDGLLHYTFNWVGTVQQDVVASTRSRWEPTRWWPSSRPRDRTTIRAQPGPGAR